MDLSKNISVNEQEQQKPSLYGIFLPLLSYYQPQVGFEESYESWHENIDDEITISLASYIKSCKIIFKRYLLVHKLSHR